MVHFIVTLGVIFLSGFTNLAASKDTCDLYATVGQNLTLPFVYGGLTNTHVLRWTHNSTIIFYGNKGRVVVGKSEDITATGSILLKNLQPSSAGIYQANVLHPNGTLAKTGTNHLCMMDKVSKPQVTYMCDPKSSAVNLNCHVARPQGLVFSWTLDGKTLPSETRPTLSISLAQLKGVRSFTCSVANKVSSEKSDTVRPTCKSPEPPTLLCFTSKTVAAVLVGGAGLILVLLIVIVVLCCCHRRIKTQMRRRDEGELRMLSLSKREPGSIGPEYETMHPPEESPPPSPTPRACYQNVSQPEAQTENTPAQLATPAEGLKPSPVPKPRTKAPKI